MAETAAVTRERGTIKAAFMFWMTVTMAAVVFIGFGITYLVPLGTGTLQPLAPIVHVHGFFYFGWMLLLVFQSLLINLKNRPLHRSLGMLGIGIAMAMVILGTQITLLFTAGMLEQGAQGVYELTYISLLALVVFPVLFVLAIRNVHDGAAHKRYILLATVVLLGAGINRIYDALFGIGFSHPMIYLIMYLTMNAWIVALLAYDWRTLGRPHRATLIGAAVNVVPQLLHVPIATSAWFAGLTGWLASLVHYG